MGDRGAIAELADRLRDARISLDTFLVEARRSGVPAREASRLAVDRARLPGRASGGRRGGILRIALPVAPGGMDPALATQGTSRLITEQLYATLTALDADARPYPDLAEWIEVSDDALVYTFGIRQGVRFHDGSPLTAVDVAFSLNRICDPATDYHLEPWTVTMAGAEAIDPSTVRLTLRQPTGPILAWLAFSGSGIVPRAAIEAGADLMARPVGSGAFRYAGGELDGTLRLERHAGGHDGVGGRPLPYLDALEFRAIPDEAERTRALLAGEIDLVALLARSGWDAVAADDRLVASATPDGRYHWLHLNCADPLLADVRVRRAIGHAVDRTAFLERAAGGRGEVLASEVVPSWHWASASDLAGFSPRADAPRARALLAEAGVTDGTPISIVVNESVPLLVDQSEVLAENLRAAGLAPTVRMLPRAGFLAQIRQPDGWQIGNNHWGSPVNDADDYFWMAYRTGGRYVVGGCGGAEIDRSIDAGRASIDQGERSARYRELQAAALERLPIIPTMVPVAMRGYTRRLRGFIPLRNAQLKTLREAWLEEG